MSSPTSTGSMGGAVNQATTNTNRRSSGTLFSGLMEQKRNSQDATANARRESFHDQKPAPGVIGQLWHNFTQGPASK